MLRRLSVLLLVVLLLVGCSRPAPAPTASREELNDKAFAAIQAKDFATAVKLAEQAVAVDPNFAPARFNLGLALYRTEKFADAVPHLKAAYELNKESVDPGWFLALALEKSGETGAAMMIMQDLAARFPSDADVAKELQRLERGPVVWKVNPGWRTLFTGDRLLVVRADGRGVDAYDQNGTIVWQMTADGPVEGVALDASGQRVLVVTQTSVQIVDVAGGAARGPALSRPADPSEKSSPQLWGDRLYLGSDRWGLNAAGGGRYMSTVWWMYRVQGGAWEQVFLEGRQAHGQFLMVSADGLTAAVSQPAGQGGELFVDGKAVRTLEQLPAALGRDGQSYVVDAGGTITRLNAEGKPVWDRAGVAGYSVLRVWPRGAEDWLVAVSPVDKGWAVLKGRDPVTFKGEGRLVALTDKYLIELSGDSLWVLDAGGELVARYKGATQVTPDQRWVFQRDGEQIKAYRLP